jgi:hypothetical protein
MLPQPSFSIGLLIFIVLLASCDREATLVSTVTCKPVDKITLPSSCYDPSNGLTLVASGFVNSTNPSQFTWSVFPQKDTTTNSNIAASLEKLLVGSETINIPESLLNNAPKVIVKVQTTGCSGNSLHSIHFSFVKRKPAGSSCLIWQQQKL